MTITRIPGGSRMSSAIIVNGMAYLKGVVPSSTEGDIQAQTADVLAQIDELLARAGTSRNRVIKVQIWLRDIADFDLMNAVYDRWLIEGAEPVRACVEARLAHPGVRVEIQATAAL